MQGVADDIDPRVVRSLRVIGEAAVAELAEVGYGALTIESVAKRAGVGKATVYRHWPGKLDLVESALEQLKSDFEVPETGTARSKVTALMTWLAGFLADSTLSACLPALVSAAHYDESLRAFHLRFSRDRQAVLIGILDEGVASGEFAGLTNTRLVSESLVGPLFYRRLMNAEPYPAEKVDAIVDLVLGPA